MWRDFYFNSTSRCTSVRAARVLLASRLLSHAVTFRDEPPSSYAARFLTAWEIRSAVMLRRPSRSGRQASRSRACGEAAGDEPMQLRQCWARHLLCGAGRLASVIRRCPNPGTAGFQDAQSQVPGRAARSVAGRIGGMVEAPKTRRRFFQFGLGTMFLLVTVLCAFLGYHLNWIRERRTITSDHAYRLIPAHARLPVAFRRARI